MNATIRSRGRPAGSRTCGPDSREGIASGRHPEATAAERLRAACLDAISRRLPLAIKFADEKTIEDLEEDLEQEINTALAAERKER